MCGRWPRILPVRLIFSAQIRSGLTFAQLRSACRPYFSLGECVASGLIFCLLGLFVVVNLGAVLVVNFRRGSRPWRKWLEPRSDFFHLGIFCINLFEDFRLNILRYTLYSYNNKNLGNFMSYFF